MTYPLLCLAGALAIFSTTMAKNPALPLFAASLGAGPAAIGVVAALSPLAGVLISLPAGLLSDCHGRRRMLLASGAVFAAAPFGYLLVSDAWALGLVRFIHGLATGVFMPVAMALVADFYTDQRGRRLGGMSTATMLGRFAAPLAGGLLLGAGTNFTAVYLGCGLAGVAALALIARLPEPAACQTPDDAPRQSTAGKLESGFRAVLSSKAVLAGCLMEAALLFAYGVFETFLPLAATAGGMSASVVGAMISAQVLAVALTKPAFGALSDKRGRRGQIVAGAALMAVAVAGLALAGSVWAIGGLCVAVGLGLSVATAASAAFVADASPPESRGAAMGLMGSIMDVGHSTGPLLGGLAAAMLGPGAAFVLGGGCLAAAMTGFFFASRAAATQGE